MLIENNKFIYHIFDADMSLHLTHLAYRDEKQRESNVMLNKVASTLRQNLVI